MKKLKMIYILILLFLLIFSFTFSKQKEIKTDVFNDYFTEPNEILYFIMEDYKIFCYTDSLKNKISVSLFKLEKFLKKEGYEIENIAVIIHNHLLDCKFSKTDKKTYQRFKKYGFKGMYLLYSNLTNKVYILEDESVN